MQANAMRIEGDYRFTNDWFDGCARGTWDQLFPQLRPSRLLEVVSYEGASACYAIDKLAHERSIELLLASGKRAYFDFIYIDGSHDAPDVLSDAVMCFRLLRKDGLMAFDDYLWQEHLPQGIDPVRCPKPAIDAFTNIYCRQLRVLSAPLYQLYVQKVAG